MDDPQPRQPAQLPVGITENSPTNESLIGAPPTIFDGDRNKADQFLTQLSLLFWINSKHPVITNPERRTALALNYIRGPKVDAWVSQQCRALCKKVNGDDNRAPTHDDTGTDETLWEDFGAEFARAFTDTAEEALARLNDLRMTGDDIEIYIATFEDLLDETECERNDRLMVDYFRQGLPTDLMRSIMKRETTPDTIDEWQSAARKEAERRRTMNVYNRGHKKGDTLPRSSEERTRFMTEGRCFECSRKGHRARDCPAKLKGESVQN